MTRCNQLERDNASLRNQLKKAQENNEAMEQMRQKDMQLMGVTSTYVFLLL